LKKTGAFIKTDLFKKRINFFIDMTDIFAYCKTTTKICSAQNQHQASSLN